MIQDSRSGQRTGVCSPARSSRDKWPGVAGEFLFDHVHNNSIVEPTCFGVTSKRVLRRVVEGRGAHTAFYFQISFYFLSLRAYMQRRRSRSVNHDEC